MFEVCIRYRLIPRNENYPGFFQNLHVPALITDRKYQTVYRSGNALSADPEALRESVGASVYLTPDIRLSGRAIQAGYAFWTEDESAVHLAQERLAEANEFIEQENTLIQAETEQKEKDAYLQSRHRIYHEIAATLYPCQQRIERLLNQMDPKAPSFRDRLAFVSVLNAYVKRKSNLMLMAAEKETLGTGDLFSALDESARYLTLSGLQTSVMQGEEEAWPAGRIIALYDAFEAVAERLIGKTASLMVSWRDHALCLAAETDRTPDLTGVALPVRARQVESTLYLDLDAGKGGEEA